MVPPNTKTSANMCEKIIYNYFRLSLSYIINMPLKTRFGKRTHLDWLVEINENVLKMEGNLNIEYDLLLIQTIIEIFRETTMFLFHI